MGAGSNQRLANHPRPPEQSGGRSYCGFAQ